MAERTRHLRRWLLYITLVLAAVLATAALIWRDDIMSNALDPKEPYQTYEPPPAPDYADQYAWALLPTHPQAATSQDPAADIFFISPTTYDGGRDWNAPIGHE